MGFNAPGTNDLARKLTDRSWRQIEQSAFKLMALDRNLTKAAALEMAKKSAGK